MPDTPAQTSADELMTPAEVQALLRISAPTLNRWAALGQIPSVKLPGGHRRYRRVDVDAILAGRPTPTA